MLLPRLCAPVRAALQNGNTSQTCVATTLKAPCPVRSSNINSPILIFVRHATHQAQGRANGPKDGAGKRLGAKKGAEEYVVPGNIIFRQRGTHWFAGDNCDMGRDHTIFATEAGYVKYYRDPLKHPKRKYIGVVFERQQTLPQPPNAARRRRLNMLAYQMESPPLVEGAETEGIRGDEHAVAAGVPVRQADTANAVKGGQHRGRTRKPTKQASSLVMRPGYMYREANWEIGRAAERAGVKVKEFKPGDRFAAWRKTVARKARNVERRRMGKRKK